MSLDLAPPEPKRDRAGRLRSKGIEISRGVRAACLALVHEGLTWQEAAIKAGISTVTMWNALQRPHVLAFVRSQRDVLRTSLSGAAIFRMRELSMQDDNRAAAVTATAKLMSEDDQQVAAGSRQSIPGLVVIIETGQPAAVQATVIEHDPTNSKA